MEPAVVGVGAGVAAAIHVVVVIPVAVLLLFDRYESHLYDGYNVVYHLFVSKCGTFHDEWYY